MKMEREKILFHVMPISVQCDSVTALWLTLILKDEKIKMFIKLLYKDHYVQR